MSTDKEDVIILELQALRIEIHDMRQTQLAHVKDIAQLKVKTGLWSAMVSAVVAISAIVVKSWS